MPSVARRRNSWVMVAQLRGLLALLLVLLAAGCAGGPALPAAIVAPGPAGQQRLAVVAGRDKLSEAYIAPVDGGAPELVATQTMPGACLRWSPDGSQAVFFSERHDLYLTQPPGTYPRLLARFADLSFRGCATWSSDGRYLAFLGFLRQDLVTTEASLPDDLPLVVAFVLEVANPSHLLRLPPHPTTYPLDIVWAPGRHSFAYMSGEGEWNHQVHIQHLDDAGELVRTISLPGFDPAWSADGSQLAFFAGESYDGSSLGIGDFVPEGMDARPPQELVIVRADGSEVRRLVVQEGFEGGSPAWSPDGLRIMWRSTPGSHGSGPFRLFMINVDGTDQRWLLKDVVVAQWAPDGSQLACVLLTDRWPLPIDRGSLLRSGPLTWYDPGWFLPGDAYVVDAADGGKTLLQRDVFELSWSPDGQLLALIKVPFPPTVGANGAAPEFSPNELYVVAPDGSGLRRLAIEGRPGSITWLRSGV